MCGIIPPEFAANPLKFATAHKKENTKKKRAAERRVRSCRRGRGWLSGSRETSAILRRNRFTPVNVCACLCVGSLSFSLAHALALSRVLLFAARFRLCACFVLVTRTHTSKRKRLLRSLTTVRSSYYYFLLLFVGFDRQHCKILALFGN